MTIPPDSRTDSIMTPGSFIRRVFGHFQNLNLLALIADLRRGDTAHGNWSSGSLLCPVAHGLSDGDAVRLMRYASQAIDLDRACDLAARDLGADPAAVRDFVFWWDSRDYGPRWLLVQLDAIWIERLADAEVVQDVLETPEVEMTNDEAPNDERMPNDEARMPSAAFDSSFGRRHSFVIG